MEDMPKFGDYPPLTIPERADLLTVKEVSSGATKYIELLYLLTGATKIVAPIGYSGYADHYVNLSSPCTDINAAYTEIDNLGGGSLFIRKGNYTLDLDLLVPSNTITFGDGMGATIFTQTSNKGFKNLHRTTTGDDNIVIKDLTINGQSLYDQQIRLTGCQSSIIQRVEFLNTLGLPTATVAMGITGLSGVQTRNITVKDCFLSNIGNYGINIDPLSTFEVVKNIQLIDNHLYNVQTGIACQRNCKNIIVDGNIYDYAQGGVCIGFKGCPSSTSVNPATNIKIQNNIFINADNTVASQAISVGDGNYHCKISNNTIQNFEKGIYLNNHPQWTQVSGNHIYGSDYGISDASGAEYSSIEDNYIYGCVYNGIKFNTYLEKVNNNTVTYCGLEGIYLQSTCDGVILNSNKVMHNGVSSPGTYAGIYLENITDATVIGNNCRDREVSPTQKYGIQESGSCDHNTYIGNNVRTSLTAGMLLVGASNLVSRNKGYLTENSGLATITSGTTSVVITHGLAKTPTLKDISIVLGENPTNDPGNIWIDNITATQFTVNCRNNPGVSNLDLAWRAILL